MVCGVAESDTTEQLTLAFLTSFTSPPRKLLVALPLA